MLGESPRAQQTRLEEASHDAIDLTSRVKRKRQGDDNQQSSTAVETLSGNGENIKIPRTGNSPNKKRSRATESNDLQK